MEESPISVDNLAKTEVVIPKNKHEEEGSKEYMTSYVLATTLLNPKLGAAKHFIVKGEDGEFDPGNANYKNIQDTMPRLRILPSFHWPMISWKQW